MKRRKEALVILFLTILATVMYIHFLMLPGGSVGISLFVGGVLLLMWYPSIRLIINPDWGRG